MSSDTSNSNNSNSYKKTTANRNKGTTFSTDYMVNYLHASDKIKPEDERVGYVKKDSDNRSDSSDDITNYINEKKNDKNYSDTNEQQSGPSQPSTNIFQRSIQGDGYKFESKNQDEGKGIDLPEDYDNYNELSEEGKMLKRLDMLRKLGELAQYKVKLSQNYNMNSDYFTMKYEYQLHTNIRAKQNFVNWTSSLMLNCIYGLEILNEKYNPWELKLTGWSEQINADITNYYDVFGEIYEKYNKPGKSMSPELKLILMLGGSALKFHLNNVALSNKLGIPNPTFNGITNGLSNGSGPMGSSSMPNQDSKMIEQMRQQAALDRMREENKKQAEALQKKSEAEHEVAAKQMQDMLLLQQKQTEFMQQESMRKQKIQEFERIKAAMEQQSQPRPFGSLNEYATPIFNNIQDNPSTLYAQQRRQEIDQQLQAMKSNVSNIKLKSQDMRDLAADKLYPQPGLNIKKRTDGISIDTSSESSVKNNKKSDSSSSSSSSESSSSSSSEVKAKSKSSGGTYNSRKNQIEKSLSSRNNQSSYSKRQYKRSGITIDT
jgi:hypothetical protein